MNNYHHIFIVVGTIRAPLWFPMYWNNTCNGYEIMVSTLQWVMSEILKWNLVKYCVIHNMRYRSGYILRHTRWPLARCHGILVHANGCACALVTSTELCEPKPRQRTRGHREWRHTSTALCSESLEDRKQWDVPCYAVLMNCKILFLTITQFLSSCIVMYIQWFHNQNVTHGVRL